MDINWLFFMLGTVGAIAPEVVRLYQIRTKPSQFRWSRYYIIISVIFALLGGVCALVLPATTLWGAFYAGISTPLVINTGLKTPARLKRPPARLKGSDHAESPHSYARSFIEAL